MDKQIIYVRGDALSPMAKGIKIIAHICNDAGGWGKGFVLAISKKWAEPEKEYRVWYNSRDNFKLGEVQFVQVEPYIYIANMIGQKGIKAGSGAPPIRYPAVEASLAKVAEKAVELGAAVHMPRIGCGLAGGRWEQIEPLINRTLINKGIDVYVYDYN
ncbi:MAG: macro domain-containing protein [Deferribacteraceae bacterium]|jgi:O-acetyl-ADP-ribose deacetylase (regulator of RNase III)|nr:macro domain-containing protein [Deferribacteraceae bacterium]